MIPLYGFLEGDTLGLLLLADEQETIAQVAEKLQRSSGLRVAPRATAATLHCPVAASRVPMKPPMAPAP